MEEGRRREGGGWDGGDPPPQHVGPLASASGVSRQAPQKHSGSEKTQWLCKAMTGSCVTFPFEAGAQAPLCAACSSTSVSRPDVDVYVDADTDEGVDVEIDVCWPRMLPYAYAHIYRQRCDLVTT